MAPKPGESCVSYGLTYAMGMGMVGVPVGFFRAHETLKKLSLDEKMQRWKNVKRTAGILSGPVGTFAACGFAYAAAECLTREYLGRDDSMTGIVGGLAVGTVLGLKRGSFIQGVGYGALFAGASILADFYTNIAHPVLDPINRRGTNAV